MTDFCLPLDYMACNEPKPSSDSSIVDGDPIFWPELYYAADYFCRTAGRSTVIEVGCGNGHNLLSVRAKKRIGIDFGQNIKLCRHNHLSEGVWIESDLSKHDCIRMADLADDQAVVVCKDVVQRLVDPSHLLTLLAQCFHNGAIIITCTPDRVRSHGQKHRGPPPNSSHVREWSLDEYETLLGRFGFPPLFAGYTYNNNTQEMKTIVTLHDRTVVDCGVPRKRPLAILSAFNEADVIGEVIVDLIQQGCDVAAIDNWSTDSTWQIMNNCREQHPDNITLEQFPTSRSGAVYYEWIKILERKEEIAAEYRGRWILHTDADEVRRSPFPGMTLAQAFKLVEESGANRVAFNLVNFRPTTDAPYRSGTLAEAFSHFEFGSRRGHFRQAKAWLQGSNRINLAASGGHVATFDGVKDYPYRFLLQHYPIRSIEHGRKKILDERQKRWSPEERKRGWHKQYDGFGANSIFRWNPDDLLPFDREFWRDYGLPIMTDIAERRQMLNQP